MNVWMLGERFLRSSMKSFRKAMCYSRSLTGTRSRSATVACPTSSRSSMVATNQSYRKGLHHQFWKHATAEHQLTVQGPEIAWDHPWFTKQQGQRRTASQTKLLWGSPRPGLKRDLPATNRLSTTPARDWVQSSVNTFGIWRRQSWRSGSPGKFWNNSLPLALSRAAVICVCGRNILSFVDLNWRPWTNVMNW